MSRLMQNTLTVTHHKRVEYVIQKPRYFSSISWLLVALFVYINTSLSFELNGPPRNNLITQLAIFCIFCVVWFACVGLRISNAIFAIVALSPAVLVEGYGFFLTPFAALTPSDLMMLVAIGLWLFKKPRLAVSYYSRLAFATFCICVLSAMRTLNPSFIGGIVRLGLSVLVIMIIFSEQGKYLKKSFVDGLLLMPITALAYLLGVDGFWRFFSFSEGRALDPYNNNEVLYGSHQVVIYLMFLVPLMFVFGRRNLVLPMLLAVAPYMVFSSSRSLIFAAGVAFLLYIFVSARTNRAFVTSLMAVLFFSGIVFGVTKLKYFSFTEDGTKAGSNVLRYTKMMKVLDTYLNSPVLGVGYGAAAVLDTRKGDVFGNTSTDFDVFDYSDVIASSEFTPLQILAETGTLGGILCIFLLLFAARRCLLVLRSTAVPSYVQFTLYAWIILFVSAFVGGNAYGTLIIFLSAPVSAYEVYVRSDLYYC